MAGVFDCGVAAAGAVWALIPREPISRTIAVRHRIREDIIAFFPNR
jgi:hypothetical protein